MPRDSLGKGETTHLPGDEEGRVPGCALQLRLIIIAIIAVTGGAECRSTAEITRASLTRLAPVTRARSVPSSVFSASPRRFFSTNSRANCSPVEQKNGSGKIVMELFEGCHCYREKNTKEIEENSRNRMEKR